MSKQKKAAQSQSTLSSNRNFKLLHQSLSVAEINFKRQTITGSTELTVLPLTKTGKLWILHLNCKQCRILGVTVNGTHNANYSYTDPTLSVCPPETKKRNLEYYDMCHNEKLKSCDSDSVAAKAGELIIRTPKDVYSLPGLWEEKPLKVLVEFSLEQPKGGVQFVFPPDNSTDMMQHVHMFTYSWENSSRLWFPCVDSYTEPCQWDLSFTVPHNMIAVSCGDLTEQLLSTDGKRKTFFYSLTVPTVAPCIAFAVGCFEVYPDPVMQEVTHFCLPGLLPILKSTVQFVNEVFGFYEELLSTRFPHSSYKLVFVDQAYQEVTSYSTLGIFSTNLLHSSRIIDQVPATRRLISQAIARQYLGSYILPQTWNDWWLPHGISRFIAGLYCRKAFGNTDYLHWIREEQRKVAEYELEHSLPPLCGSQAALHLDSSAGSPSTSSSGGRLTFHPKLMSEKEMDMFLSKAQLIIRMIQIKIGHDLLLQVFNKLLTLASTASQNSDYSVWQNLLVSTAGFMKLILTVSGKDLSTFVEQWVCRNGVPRFFASYRFVRKKNIIELKLKQDLVRGYSKFVGPVGVIVQEFDGRFSHNIQVEDSVTTHELPCHSKIRKAKKRKVPLTHGEEVEIDISNLDMEVPVLWVRVDPDLQWICHLTLEQSDITWQSLLKYEREANAQLEAIEALEGYQTTATRDALRDAVMNSSFYFHVRIQAAKSLAKLLTDTAVTGGSPVHLITLYQKLYGSAVHQSILRYHDFSDFAAYFLQKALPQCVAAFRNVHKQCTKEVVQFLMELFKYSDNQTNKYSDSYFTSGLIDALAETITPKVAVALPSGVDLIKTPTAALTRESQTILQEVVQHLNIEKVLPSYKYTVTVSCLNCLRVLQRNGHIPSDTSIFKEYASVDNFIDVRLAAVRALVDIVQVDQDEGGLNFLLDLAENDHPIVRLTVLTSLAANAPFNRRSDSKLDTLPLVERLWCDINTKFFYDARLRNAAVEVYSALYGRLTPKCVPQGLGVVIDLKEKVARSNLTSPIVSPRTPDDKSPAGTSSSLQVQPTGMATPPLLKVTSQQERGVSPLPSLKSSQPSSLSLKISTARLKRPSPFSVEDSRSVTGSPESALSAGYLSDDSATPSPYLQPTTVVVHAHKHKRHKGEHKQKHKKKKSKKSKHKHKHSSREMIDVETVDQR